jgi:hypothetical protein
MLQFRVRSESSFASSTRRPGGHFEEDPKAIAEVNFIISMMQAVNGHDRLQGIVARAPQATSIQISSSTQPTTSPFLPNPSKSAVPLNPANDNKSAVKVRYPELAPTF